MNKRLENKQEFINADWSVEEVLEVKPKERIKFKEYEEIRLPRFITDLQKLFCLERPNNYKPAGEIIRDAISFSKIKYNKLKDIKEAEYINPFFKIKIK